MQELYITGAGVSSASGIPTFRGSDGFWTVGSVNYTPQEMATRYMYENHPDQFLLWYFKRFIAYNEMYTEIYRFSEAEQWMNSAKKMIFIGTSFSVNITSIALRIGVANNIPIEIVDPKPMKLNYPNIKYFEMSGEEYCKLKEDL